jgi:hypothetical protein
MKKLLVILILSCNFNAFAEIIEQRDQAIIQSIDSFDSPQNFVEVSEEGLPTDLYKELMTQIALFQFTLLEETEVQAIFAELVKNPSARMKYPGGACAQRRYYIQKLLKEKDLITGQLFIKCPSNDGHLRLKDQVSGNYYSYTNYHDSNIVAIKTSAGIKFRVLDLQFEERPVSLEDYLGEVESSQKIHPLKTRGDEASRGICYWSISTEFLTF